MLDFKFMIATGRKWMYAGDGQQRPSYVTWDTEPDWQGDITLIYQNYQNYINYYKPNTPLIFTAQFQGNLLGAVSGTSYYENVTITLPCKVDTWKTEATKNPVSGTLKLISQYDPTNLGAAYTVSINAQQAPTYLS